MAWTLSRIETRVRAVTGWSEESDLSTTTLREAINYIYTRRIPYHLNWDNLQRWVWLTTIAAKGNYTFDDNLTSYGGATLYGPRVRYLEPPFTLQSDWDPIAPLEYTENWEGFWSKYPPETPNADGQPSIVLQRARQLFVRPRPDAVYNIQVWASLWPAELATSGATLVDEGWGEIIIPGAIARLNEDDEDSIAGDWWPIFMDRLENEASGQAYKPPGLIPPRW